MYRIIHFYCQPGDSAWGFENRFHAKTGLFIVLM